MNSKTFFTGLLLIFLIFSIAQALEHQITFTLDQLNLVSEGEYTRLVVEGCRHTFEQGKPEMPVRAVTLVVPPLAEFQSLEIISWDSEEIEGAYLVFPAQKVDMENLTYEFTPPDEEAYQSTALLPVQPVVYAGSGRMMGCRIFYFHIYPIQYLPAEKKLIFNQRLEFRVNYILNGEPPVYSKVKTPSSWARTIDVLTKVIDNPEDLMKHLPLTKIVDVKEAVKIDPQSMPVDNIEQGYPYGIDYVIITTSSLSEAFQEFADWKTQHGVPTEVRTISWIKEHYTNGCDDAETIRNFIREAYEF